MPQKPRASDDGFPPAGPFDPFFWGVGRKISGERPGLFHLAPFPSLPSGAGVPLRCADQRPRAVCRAVLPDLSFYRVEFPGLPGSPCFEVRSTDRYSILRLKGGNGWRTALFHRPPDEGLSIKVSTKGGLVLDAAGFGECRARLLGTEGKDRPGVAHLREALWGRGLGNGFGSFQGDRASFSIDVPPEWPPCRIALRYHLDGPETNLELRLDGGTVFAGTLPPTGTEGIGKRFRWLSLGSASLSEGRHRLELLPLPVRPFPERASLVFDCIYLSPFLDPTREETLHFPAEVMAYAAGETAFMERLTPGDPPVAGAAAPGPFRIVGAEKAAEELALPAHSWEPKGAAWVVWDLPPDTVARFAWGRNREEVVRNLEAAEADETLSEASRSAANIGKGFPSVAPTLAALSAAVLSDVVFPLPGNASGRPLFRGGRSMLPGQADLGWHAAGLLPLDPVLAIRTIQASLSSPGESSPFFQGGPGTPSQVFAVWELCQQTGDFRPAKVFYPGLFRMLSAMAETDREGFPAWCRRFAGVPEGDSYPPARAAEAALRHPEFSSPGTVALLISACRLLETAAERFGYRAEQTIISSARLGLQRTLLEEMYDPDEGVFRYLDEWSRDQVKAGETAINTGIEGLLPLITGILPSRVERSLLEALDDPERFRRHCGLGSLDKSAPAYRGEDDKIRPVWQWLFAKFLIWKGRTKQAADLLRSFLHAWNRAVSENGHMPESLLPDGSPDGSSTGGGPALSLLMLASLHASGTVIPGLYTVIEGITREAGTLEFTLWEPNRNGRRGVLAALPEGQYRVRLGEEEWLGESEGGLLGLEIPAGEGGPLRIRVEPL